MAKGRKKKSVTKGQEGLFQEIHSARYGDGRPHRMLFLPKTLVKEAGKFSLPTNEQEKAHEILIRWADLESSGKLDKMNETTLQGDFLADVFGEALGYKRFSENLARWELQAQFGLPGGTADAAIGFFGSEQEQPPRALIELKGPTVNVDRGRFNGRTPVQQCWDYLNAVPECPWGIVCNYVSFRLYHRNKTPRAFELFTLQELRKLKRFREFYALFERNGLLSIAGIQDARADRLLVETDHQQRKVGQELYKYYAEQRVGLIDYLRNKPHNKPLDKAIRIAQKLLDRIIFVAFCEDRGLLPAGTIEKAYSQIPPSFVKVTNPQWQNFLHLFRSIDEGNPDAGIHPYNGGLFEEDEDIDNLKLDDRWTNFFKNISNYDFRDEVNVDVLGHIFEKSINELERIRTHGLFETKIKDEDRQPKMGKSAKRKRFGVYYTPQELTDLIVRNTVERVIEVKFQEIAHKEKLSPERIESAEPDRQLAQYWRECFQALRGIKICDPACGSGAFLIQAYQVMEDHYGDVLKNLEFHDEKKDESLGENIPDFILHDNLFGVDLSKDAVEITQLALWIRSARPGKKLTDLSGNIICRNSLVTDPTAHPQAIDWAEAFPQIFSRPNAGFDCIIGNPPWERMKLQEREFFDVSTPKIASAVSAATRRKMIARLEKSNPDLYKRYINAKEAAERTLDHVRNSGNFPLTGKGDINTYTVFAELAKSIVAANGQVGLLVPSGIATDHSTRKFFNTLMDDQSLVAIYDFENRKGLFADLHRSFKFCALIFGGQKVKTDAADFVFFAHELADLKDKNRHISLSRQDMALVNPNTCTCPIFRTEHDAELTKAVYRRVPILVDKNRKEGGNPWGIKFLRMFDQTNAAELFHTAEQLKAKGFKQVGNRWTKRKQAYLPLYEAKMIQAYDHRAASVELKPENWFRQGQTAETSLVSHQNPEFLVQPRWWISNDLVEERWGEESPSALLAFKNVTSPTNQRTMIASFIPSVGVINSAPIIQFDQKIGEPARCCLLANLNAHILDYVARQKIGNVNLNFFLIEQFPMFSPDFYADKCPWDKRRTLESWISGRVLKLTCTSDDMRPLAEAVGFDPPVHKWKPDERAKLLAELDAAYFILYGIEREDVEYILSTFSGNRRRDKEMFDSLSLSDHILQEYDRLRKCCTT